MDFPSWAEPKDMICSECKMIQQKQPKDPEQKEFWYIERHTETCSRYPNNLKLIDKANGNG